MLATSTRYNYDDPYCWGKVSKYNLSEQIFTAAIGEKDQAAATRGYNGARTWNRGKTQVTAIEQGR